MNQRGELQLSESLALKAVSLLLALILWITILGFKPEEVVLNVKFEPLVAPNAIITTRVPKQIQFTLTGPRVHLKDLEKKIQPIRPDLRRHKETIVAIAINAEDHLPNLPPGIKIVSITPAIVSIRLEEFTQKKIPIQPLIVGDPAPGWKVSELIVRPPQVLVSGPKSRLEELASISTEPIEIQGISKNLNLSVGVDIDPLQNLRLPNETNVQVQVHLKQTRGNP